MKLFFIRYGDSPLAAKDDYVIGKIRDLLLQIDFVEEVVNPVDADGIILVEEGGFKTHRYLIELLNDSIVGVYPEKVYTINIDDSAHGLLKGLYACLPKGRFSSERHYAVPYWFSPNKYIFEFINEKKEVLYLGSWRGNLKSNKKLRTKILDAYADGDDFKIEVTDSWMNHGKDEMVGYVKMISNSRFSLCPAGFGPASHRIYESMRLGVSPVIIADNFVPPEGPAWNRFSIRVEEKDVDSLEQILGREKFDSEEMGKVACREWIHYFEGDRVFKYYANMLMECIDQNRGKSNRGDEISRWYSFTSLWGNEWTVAQRIWRKLRKLRVIG